MNHIDEKGLSWTEAYQKALSLSSEHDEPIWISTKDKQTFRVTSFRLDLPWIMVRRIIYSDERGENNAS